MTTTGERIKQFRKNKGYKQYQLAEKSGISRISIGYYERDERQPGKEQVEKIAAALDVSPVDIMGWDYANDNDKTALLIAKKIVSFTDSYGFDLSNNIYEVQVDVIIKPQIQNINIKVIFDFEERIEQNEKTD